MARPAHPIRHDGFPDTLVAAVLDDALAHAATPGEPTVYGITGLQGSGKSTLAAQLARAARGRGLSVVVLSIDDFYRTRRERAALARRVHPLLASRGPPGTHDVGLACAVLDRLRELDRSDDARSMRAGDSVRLPRFDKLGDRRLPPSRWRSVTRRPELIVFEGWFLKVPPEHDAALATPLNRLEEEADPDAIWRSYCNAALAQYAPLWARIERLLWLRGPGFEQVPAWRWQQEQALQAHTPQRPAMSRAQLEQFVLLFERVSRHGQRVLADVADVILDIDRQRNPLGELLSRR